MQVIKIAKARTKEQNESKAIKKFRIQLENDKYFYIVENETTNSELYMKCYDKTTAEKYCPQRWKAMNRWLESAKTVRFILTNTRNYRAKNCVSILYLFFEINSCDKIV